MKYIKNFLEFQKRFLIISFLGIRVVSSDEGINLLKAEPHLFSEIDENFLKSPAAFLLNSSQIGRVSPSTVSRFYEQFSYQPVWINAQGLTPAGENALITLRQVTEEGLRAQDYNAILTAFNQPLPSPIAKEDQIRLEIQLTQHMLMYIDQLYGERVDPEKVSKLVHLKAVRIEADLFLAQKLKEDTSGQNLSRLTVNHPQYQHLKEVLGEYRSKQSLGEGPRLSVPSSVKLERGSEGPIVIALKKQLWAHGDLGLLSEHGTFDEKVEEAVKQFQFRHGLEVDGKVGPETIAALNVSLEDRIRQIIVSMERWRWLPEDKGDRYVMVNIAGYILQAFEGGQKALEMPVIIGRQFRQTPIFVSDIDFVRFNPTWHVPQSIAVKDKLPLLRKDPEYFQRKGYQIYTATGERIDPQEVNWNSVTPSSFTYKLKQSPGPQNALGHLFFHINTPFDVYLHGTPDVALFKKAKRSFSSGCIRLGDPDKFAQFVLNDDQRWNEIAISEAVNSAKTLDIKLPKPLKVYIVYQTVWQDDQGKIHFGDDLYNQDKVLYQALNP